MVNVIKANRFYGWLYWITVQMDVWRELILKKLQSFYIQLDTNIIFLQNKGGICLDKIAKINIASGVELRTRREGRFKNLIKNESSSFQKLKSLKNSLL